jgi:hypothetical protein
MGALKVGLFHQFTGFDFLFTLVALCFWVAYLLKGENAIIFVLGKAWKKSFFRKFLANVMFKGWAFFGGLVLGIFPDMMWVGAWKVALLLGALFVLFTRSEKKQKQKSAAEEKVKTDSTADAATS